MRFRTRLAVVAAVPILALAGGLVAASSASAAPTTTINVSFSHSPDSSAHWLPVHSGFDLYVAGDPATAFATVDLHHFDTSLADTPEPSFTTDFYTAGTPRWALFLNNGQILFGYPSQFGNQWEYTGRPAGSPLYVSYAAAKSEALTDGATTVTGVSIVMDGSAGTPQEAHITDVVYDTQQLTS